MPRLIPPRYTPAQAAQLVGVSTERLCRGDMAIRIDLIRQITNNTVRRRRHLGRATCEVAGRRFEAKGPAPVYQVGERADRCPWAVRVTARSALSCLGVIRKSLNCQHTWDYSGCKAYHYPLVYRHRTHFSLPLRLRHLCLGHRHRR